MPWKQVRAPCSGVSASTGAHPGQAPAANPELLPSFLCSSPGRVPCLTRETAYSVTSAKLILWVINFYCKFHIKVCLERRC